MSKAKLVLILVAFGMAACGKVGDLEPRAGNGLPPKAYGQKEEQSSAALTRPSVQARPGRTDELLKRSERRVDDQFDLAPGKTAKPFDPEEAVAEELEEKPS
jgi:predicted small lipoprotein YifL